MELVYLSDIISPKNIFVNRIWDYSDNNDWNKAWISDKSSSPSISSNPAAAYIAARLSAKSGISIVPLKITTSEPFMMKNHSFFQLGAKVVQFDIKIQDEIVVENLKTPDMTEIGLRNKICSIIKEKI